MRVKRTFYGPTFERPAESVIELSPRLAELFKQAVEIFGTPVVYYKGSRIWFDDREGEGLRVAIKSVNSCPQLKAGQWVTCDGRCGSKCPFLRAAQGCLTQCAKIVKSSAECSSRSEEQSGEDSCSSAPEQGKDEKSRTCSDKPDGDEQDFSPESPSQEEREQEASASCSLETDSANADQSQVAQAEADGTAAEAPQAASGTSDDEDFIIEEVLEEDDTPDEKIVEEMLSGAEETSSGLTPSDSSQPESEGVVKADGGSPATTPSSSFDGEGEGPESGELSGVARAGEGEGEDEMSSFDSSLDSCPVGADKAGKEESCREKAGQDSSNPSEVGGAGSSKREDHPASTSKGCSSLWEMEFNPKEDQCGYGGGGGQAHGLSAKDATTSVEKQVTLLLRQFLSSLEDLFRKRGGWDRWDAKKVVCSSAFAPHRLPAAKFSRPASRRLSLWVDVSGSVSYLAGFIINLITAACKDMDAQVVIGSEAHPQVVLPEDFLHSGKSWADYMHMGRNYIADFADQVADFLRHERLGEGTTIVIWSDYMDIYADNLKKLSQLLRPYKVVWLCSHGPEKSKDYEGNESFKIETFARKEGHVFLWGIDSPEGIRKALKEINIRKRR